MKLSLALIFIFFTSRLCAQDLSLWRKETLTAARTADSVKYLTDEEKKVLTLVNLARLDGNAFIKNVLDPFVKENSTPDNDYLRSLYIDLRNVSGLKALLPNNKLSQSAAYHANDMGANGKTGHNSSDGTACFDRIRRYHDGGYMAENCDYGYSDALHIVLHLMIDDGVPSKGHRASILSPYYKRVGISIKPHQVWSFNCVMDFSD